MYEVTIKKTFSAAHALAIGGKCEALHGHNFVVEVSVECEELDESGLVLDFRDLKSWTNEILDRLDHTFVNDLPEFKGISPTSENLARFIFDELKKRLTGNNDTSVSRVTVWESESAKVTYRP